MKWLIGVDLRETATGAIEFAKWMAENTTTGATELVPVHVLEESYLLQVLRHEHMNQVEAKAEQDVRALVERVGLTSALENVRITRGISVEESLVREFDAARAHALLIGREAPAGERNIVRLGRVARRIVRRLPCPVVVAPPNLKASDVGAGPVILASDLSETCGPAARFAARFAASIGRPLVLAHVVPSEADMLRYVPTTTIDQFYSQVGLDRQRDVEAWQRSHGLEGASAIIAHGDPVARLSAIAEVEGAPIVVCGSRLLGTVERVFVTSVATDLSCWAGVAIAIVPPT